MKILVAEDDAVSRRILESFLAKWGYELVVAQDGEEAWRVICAEGAPQLAILDWMMPRLDGLEICRRIREREAGSYIYILLLTAKGQKQDVIQGLNAGADDYLSKPFHAGELQARLRSGRRILALESMLISAREALRFQATHDPLTGLWNRVAAAESLRRELERARRRQAPVAVIMADLDHFKNVNDTHGHLAGDTALRQVAERMSNLVRAYDTVARFGGEEFLLVLPDCGLPDALRLGERLRQAFAEKPLDLPEARVDLTLSLGVVSIEPTAAIVAEEVIQAADHALYRAKRHGRNRVEPATEAEMAKCRAVSQASGQAPHPKRTAMRSSAG